MWVKKIVLVVFVSLLAISCSHGGGNALQDTKGHSFPASKLSGKWVVVSYWADWCGNCAEETPALNSFAENLKDKNVVFYGVNYDHLTGDALKAAMEKLNITYPVLKQDPGQIWHLKDPGALPVTFIIDPNGQVVKTILGGNSEESLLNFLHEAQSNEKK